MTNLMFSILVFWRNCAPYECEKYKSSASMDRDTFYCIERLSYDDDRKSRRSGLLKKAFATDDYTKEDLQYVPDVLKHCSRKTLWRTFDSCNNYKFPNQFLNRYEASLLVHKGCRKKREKG